MGVYTRDHFLPLKRSASVEETTLPLCVESPTAIHELLDVQVTAFSSLSEAWGRLGVS